jgi:transcriptional regulator with XRE-family HTH domain
MSVRRYEQWFACYVFSNCFHAQKYTTCIPKSQGFYTPKYKRVWYYTCVHNFGDWLVDEREKKGLSQNKLAVLMRFSQAAVSRVESGKVEPTSDFIRAAALALSMPVEIVYRQAGLIPPSSKHDEWAEQMVIMASKLPAASRNAIEHLVKYFYDQEHEQDNNQRGKKK